MEYQIIGVKIMAATIRHLVLLTAIAMTVFSGFAYSDYQLVWSDEFDGTSLNAANWSYQIMGDGGNNELQYYTSRAQNSWVANGVLTIQALKEDYVVGGTTYHYTSARLRTANKQDFLYGKFEARIKLPKGQGIWPAFWMMPTDSVYGGWAASGEIDIMESINQAGSVYGTLHYGGPCCEQNTSSGGSYSPGGVDFSQNFHVYTLEWEPDVMRWYVDGILYSTKTSSQWYTNTAPENDRAPFDQWFHFILNVAVGGNWPGYPDATTTFPQQMQIDYIRVYQNTENYAPSVSITNPAEGSNLPAGNILIEASASDIDGTVSTVEFYNGTTLLGQDTTSPYSFTWASVPGGCYTLTAKAIDDLGSSNTHTVHITVGTGCGQQPFPDAGTPSVIPGRIQAENFDHGGEGLAYHDTSSGNSGNKYRTTDNVDIESCTDTGGGYNIGWMAAGEWLEYTVDVKYAGTYTLKARVAALDPGKTFYVAFDGVNKTGNLTVPDTNGWQNWNTVSKTVTLSAGVQIMRFYSNSADFNLNYIEIAADKYVPGVIGMSRTLAESVITSSGLTVGQISQSFHNAIPAGSVIDQNPIDGTAVPTGCPVDLEISLGIAGDLNTDGSVDIEDVDIMALEWLGTPVQADIEPVGGDGVVNFADFAVLAANWGL
jgi:beta-glucanase (GH16 family)